jgi:hypothetical protein
VQDLGGSGPAARKIIEDLLGDQVLAVGVPDGQRQPEHEADGTPPGGAQAVLAGHRDG